MRHEEELHRRSPPPGGHSELVRSIGLGEILNQGDQFVATESKPTCQCDQLLRLRGHDAALGLASDGYSSATAKHNDYIYGTGTTPIEQVNVATGTVSYLLADQLGSTRAITNSGGSVTGSFTYNAWGGLQASSGSATAPFLYAGGYLDSASGLYYFRARWYDAATGEWMSLDPEAKTTEQPYSYADEDPVNTTDSTGLTPFCVLDLDQLIHYSNSGNLSVHTNIRCEAPMSSARETIALYGPSGSYPIRGPFITSCTSTLPKAGRTTWEMPCNKAKWTRNGWYTATAYASVFVEGNVGTAEGQRTNYVVKS